MTPSARSLRFGPGRRGTAGIATVALLAGLGLAGCGIGQAVSAVKKVTHDVAANKATIDQFTTQMKATAGTAFEVTYVTTGKSPIRIIYAVRPPHGLTFRERSAVGKASAAVRNKLFGFYTASHPRLRQGGLDADEL
jgi:F0F1-type ATP synthase membrane subunit c/vacuolar-type H+-ATPase subunit K